eukprot:CAMPEP_0173392706 /NCGR_PEP_ID=MMETSP1356-20130122/20808_1 /TAXON_ID=77927 ORGANISM="Hemiselmis virescens, Strain PCC157" /NCGR_SAMPLE_ID=MMETSP1356 /ASSEMBLY_ACC=CAM_ASM_000847 /LENGTH=145 /DNA_ID=CAMNT_0014350577 /DNA_START=37 /DNA_END=475 /DNA_ORIENTATION=-
MTSGTTAALWLSAASAGCLVLLLTVSSSSSSSPLSASLQPLSLEETVVVLPPNTPQGDVKQLPMMLVPGTAVTVPVCDMGSCRHYQACVDRWDFATEHGQCAAYGDWTKRMAYCEKDKDVFGMLASSLAPSRVTRARSEGAMCRI